MGTSCSTALCGESQVLAQGACGMAGKRKEGEIQFQFSHSQRKYLCLSLLFRLSLHSMEIRSSVTGEIGV